MHVSSNAETLSSLCTVSIWYAFRMNSSYESTIIVRLGLFVMHAFHHFLRTDNWLCLLSKHKKGSVNANTWRCHWRLEWIVRIRMTVCHDMTFCFTQYATNREACFFHAHEHLGHSSIFGAFTPIFTCARIHQHACSFGSCKISNILFRCNFRVSCGDMLRVFVSWFAGSEVLKARCAVVKLECGYLD